MTVDLPIDPLERRGGVLLGIFACGRLSGVGDESFLHAGIQIMEYEAAI